jgi:phage major head subunit gpT-like protein
LGAVPGVREFLGERQARDLSAFNYNIKNKEWENTLGIKRTDIEDQKLGMVATRVRDLAVQAARYPEQLLMEFLAAAALSDAAPYLCYDAGGLFDNTHPAPDMVGGAVQDNLDGSALAIATLWAGIAKMQSFRDDKGNIIGCTPDVLLVEPCLEETALELCAKWQAGSAQMAALASKGIDVLVSPYLYSTVTVANGNWFLLDTKRVVKPLILQERSPIEFGSLEADSESGFLRGEYYYGTRARYNVGAGFWPAIIANIGAG